MKMIALVLITVFVTSCASKNDEREIRKEAAESNISNSQALGETIHDLIHSSKTLSSAQKKELNQIIEINKNTAMALMEESYQFRSILIQELLSGKSSPERIALIKNDIKQIEEKRLKNTFDTVEKISNIVSAHPEKQEFGSRMLELDRPIRR
jgi:protein involved in polysaccharide export with SLBB domain